MLKKISPWFSMTLIVFIIEMTVFSVAAPGFLNFSGWMSMTQNFVFLGIMALGQALVIIAGGIDLSVGSIVSLSGIMMGIFWQHGVNIWLASLLAILVGGLAGWINGQLVIRTGIQPLIVTLSTLFIYGSLAAVINPQDSIFGFPNSFLFLGTGELFGVIPVQLIVFIAVSLLFGFVLQRTTFGRRVIFIGNNESVAAYSGVSVERAKLWTYIASGLASGLASILLGAYFASVRGDMGQHMELSVITICLVGGISVFGGVGTVSGVALGTFILGMLNQGLNVLNVPAAEQSIVTGAILILAVAMQQVNVILSRRRRKKAPIKEVTGGTTDRFRPKG